MITTRLLLSLRALTIGWLCMACSAAPEPEAHASSGDDELQKMFADMQQASQRIRELVGPYQQTGNLLGEVIQLRSLGVEYEGAEGMVAMMLAQMAGTTESFLGNHRAALRAYDQTEEAPSHGQTKQNPELPSLTGLRAEDAVDVLVRAARDSRAVVINEAHHVAQHRVLTRRLLSRLREIGFTHFAAEGLATTDTELAGRGYPTDGTGYYLQEPQYADLVRQALALGYQVVAYEKPGMPAVREPGQAQNLAEQIFSDPGAKALIHVGYSHNLETAESFGGVGAMAWHLRELTTIDPLTVDQTRMRERGRPELEDSLFRRVVETFELQQPVVLVDAEGAPWQPPGADRDVTVFSPPTRDHQGRPHWLFEAGDRRTLVLPRDLCGSSEKCLVEARLANEGDDAVPMDRIEVQDSDSEPILVVPEKRIRIRVLNDDLQTLKTWHFPDESSRANKLIESGE